MWPDMALLDLIAKDTLLKKILKQTCIGNLNLL